MAIEFVGRVRAVAEGGRNSRGREIPDLDPDSDRADLQQHGAVRPAEAAGAADAAFPRRDREDRQGAAQRPHRDPMGRLPGGAGLGELLRQGPGRFPHRDHRRADENRRRRAGRDRARLSPLLRQPGRRAHGAAQGHGHHGRDDQCHRRGRQAADPVLPYAGGQGAHRRRLLRAAEGTEAQTRDRALSRPRSTTTTPAATRRGSPPPAGMRGWTASAPNAAWRGAIRRGCRRCLRRTPVWPRARSYFCSGEKALA